MSSNVLAYLLDLVGRGRARIHREVDHDFRAERLTQLDVPAQPARWVAIARLGRVLDVLGANAHDDVPALVLGESRVVVQGELLYAEIGREAAVRALDRGL